MEIRGLPENRRRSDRRPGTDNRTDGGAGADEPGQLLPLQRGSQAGSRYGPARRHPAYRVGVAQLWAAAHHRGTAAEWMDGEPGASLPAAARGQPAMRPQAQVRCHHRLQSRAQGLSESGGGPGADGYRSTLASRYHVCPAARGVRLPGGDSGRLFAPGYRLGPGSQHGRRADVDGAAHGPVATKHPTWSGASLGSRQPVCKQRLHRPAEGAPCNPCSR